MKKTDGRPRDMLEASNVNGASFIVQIRLLNTGDRIDTPKEVKVRWKGVAG